MMISRCLVLALICICTLTAVEDRRATIHWGTHLDGPTIARADFEGRLLLLVMWDMQVDNVEWIKGLSEIRKRYGDKLLLVASHWQSPSAQAVRDAWRIVKGGEYITLMHGTQVAGDSRLAQARDAGAPALRGRRRGLGDVRMSVSYSKACFLFGEDGRQLVHGSIEEVEKVLPSAYKSATGHLAVSEQPWQYVAKEAATLGEAAKTMTPTLISLREALAGADMLQIEEAQRLIDRVGQWAARELAEVQRVRTLDATSCQIRLDYMCKWLKGDELGAPFEELAKELKGDKDFQALRKAEAVMRAIGADADHIGLAEDPEAAKLVKSNASLLKKIHSSLNKIIEAMPGSQAATTAADMLASYGLD